MYVAISDLWSTVAVGAFKVVVELDVKRRDNDKKISVLFLEMKDMMSVLLEYVQPRQLLAIPSCSLVDVDCAP